MEIKLKKVIKIKIKKIKKTKFEETKKENTSLPNFSLKSQRIFRIRGHVTVRLKVKNWGMTDAPI